MKHLLIALLILVFSPYIVMAQYSTEVKDYTYSHKFSNNMITFCIENQKNCIYYDLENDVVSIDNQIELESVVEELMKMMTIIHKQFICKDSTGMTVHCNCEESRKYDLVLAMSKNYRDIDYQPYVWVDSEKIFTSPSIFSSKHGGYILIRY